MFPHLQTTSSGASTASPHHTRSISYHAGGPALRSYRARRAEADRAAAAQVRAAGGDSAIRHSASCSARIAHDQHGIYHTDATSLASVGDSRTQISPANSQTSRASSVARYVTPASPCRGAYTAHGAAQRVDYDELLAAVHDLAHMVTPHAASLLMVVADHAGASTASQLESWAQSSQALLQAVAGAANARVSSLHACTAAGSRHHMVMHLGPMVDLIIRKATAACLVSTNLCSSAQAQGVSLAARAHALEPALQALRGWAQDLADQGLDQHHYSQAYLHLDHARNALQGLDKRASELASCRHGSPSVTAKALELASVRPSHPIFRSMSGAATSLASTYAQLQRAVTFAGRVLHCLLQTWRLLCDAQLHTMQAAWSLYTAAAQATSDSPGLAYLMLNSPDVQAARRETQRWLTSHEPNVRGQVTAVHAGMMDINFTARSAMRLASSVHTRAQRSATVRADAARLSSKCDSLLHSLATAQRTCQAIVKSLQAAEELAGSHFTAMVDLADAHPGSVSRGTAPRALQDAIAEQRPPLQATCDALSAVAVCVQQMRNKVVSPGSAALSPGGAGVSLQELRRTEERCTAVLAQAAGHVMAARAVLLGIVARARRTVSVCRRMITQAQVQRAEARTAAFSATSLVSAINAATTAFHVADDAWRSARHALRALLAQASTQPAAAGATADELAQEASHPWEATVRAMVCACVDLLRTVRAMQQRTAHAQDCAISSTSSDAAVSCASLTQAMLRDPQLIAEEAQPAVDTVVSRVAAYIAWMQGAVAVLEAADAELHALLPATTKSTARCAVQAATRAFIDFVVGDTTAQALLDSVAPECHAVQGMVDSAARRSVFSMVSPTPAVTPPCTPCLPAQPRSQQLEEAGWARVREAGGDVRRAAEALLGMPGASLLAFIRSLPVLHRNSPLSNHAERVAQMLADAQAKAGFVPAFGTAPLTSLQLLAWAATAAAATAAQRAGASKADRGTSQVLRELAVRSAELRRTAKRQQAVMVELGFCRMIGDHVEFLEGHPGLASLHTNMEADHTQLAVCQHSAGQAVLDMAAHSFMTTHDWAWVVRSYQRLLDQTSRAVCAVERATHSAVLMTEMVIAAGVDAEATQLGLHAAVSAPRHGTRPAPAAVTPQAVPQLSTQPAARQGIHDVEALDQRVNAARSLLLRHYTAHARMSYDLELERGLVYRILPGHASDPVERRHRLVRLLSRALAAAEHSVCVAEAKLQVLSKQRAPSKCRAGSKTPSQTMHCHVDERITLQHVAIFAQHAEATVQQLHLLESIVSGGSALRRPSSKAVEHELSKARPQPVAPGPDLSAGVHGLTVDVEVAGTQSVGHGPVELPTSSRTVYALLDTPLPPLHTYPDASTTPTLTGAQVPGRNSPPAASWRGWRQRDLTALAAYDVDDLRVHELSLPGPASCTEFFHRLLADASFAQLQAVLPSAQQERLKAEVLRCAKAMEKAHSAIRGDAEPSNELRMRAYAAVQRFTQHFQDAKSMGKAISNGQPLFTSEQVRTYLQHGHLPRPPALRQHHAKGARSQQQRYRRAAHNRPSTEEVGTTGRAAHSSPAPRAELAAIIEPTQSPASAETVSMPAQALVCGLTEEDSDEVPAGPLCCDDLDDTPPHAEMTGNTVTTPVITVPWTVGTAASVSRGPSARTRRFESQGSTCTHLQQQQQQHAAPSTQHIWTRYRTAPPADLSSMDAEPAFTTQHSPCEVQPASRRSMYCTPEVTARASCIATAQSLATPAQPASRVGTDDWVVAQVKQCLSREEAVSPHMLHARAQAEQDYSDSESEDRIMRMTKGSFREGRSRHQQAQAHLAGTKDGHDITAESRAAAETLSNSEQSDDEEGACLYGRDCAGVVRRMHGQLADPAAVDSLQRTGRGFVVDQGPMQGKARKWIRRCIVGEDAKVVRGEATPVSPSTAIRFMEDAMQVHDPTSRRSTKA